jgi:hypothetical protein
VTLLGDFLSLVNAQYPLDLSPHALDLSPHALDLSLQTTNFIKYQWLTGRELIELIEQEGATRFFVKI